MKNKWLSAASGALMCVVVAAFTASSVVAVPPMPQLIVEFDDTVFDPEGPRFLEGLSNAVGYPLVYVRPTLEGSHVLRVARPLDEKQFNRLLGRLTAHQNIRRAQIDRAVRVAPRTGAMSHVD